MDEEIEYKKTNRETKKIPKLAKGWCSYCDQTFKPFSEKCWVCGRREKGKRYKKE